MKTVEYIQLKKLSAEAGLLKLSGELTVKNAQEIKESILQGIQSFKQLEILLDQPEAIDITIFQLLEATRRSMQQSKKELTLTLRLSDDARELWRKAGLN